MAESKNIHIGHLIKSKVEGQQMSISEFARKIHCDRSTVYHLFSQESIDITRLLKISKVLNFDFINEVYLKKPSPSICKHQSTCPFFQQEV